MTIPVVFISHSSHDAEPAGLLCKLVREAFGLTDYEIRCTSVDAYQLTAGADVLLTLRKEVVKASAFIVLLSPSSIVSTYVLVEIGARLGKTTKGYFPILAPKTSDRLLPSPLSNYHTPDCLHSDGTLHSFLDALKDSMARPLRAVSNYAEDFRILRNHVDEFKPDDELPPDVRKGIVSRDDLRHRKSRFPGEVFAVEILARDVKLARVDKDGKEKVEVTIDRRSVKKCLISNKGKSDRVRKYVTKENEADLRDRDSDIHQFLLDRRRKNLTIPSNKARLRWASGGVLSIVTFKGEKWVPLFFRDIHPYGWNIALGQPERQFDPKHEGYTLENELNQPWNYICREFLEETMIIDRAPAPPEPVYRRTLNLSYLGQDTPVKIAKNFAEEHGKLRKTEDGLEVLEQNEARIKANIIDTDFYLKVVDDEGCEHERDNVLICFSLLDLGIEVVTVVEYDLDENDYMLDGEILVDKKGNKELVRMPIALMPCSYLAGVFGPDCDQLHYTLGPEPSIEVQRAPAAGDVHLFDWDIRQRMLTVGGADSSKWKQQRYIDWFDKFRRDFFDRDGAQTKGDLSQLFVPGTAKILNLYFSLLWEAEGEK